MITAGTLAIALTAPFTGAIADVLGRKRLITVAMFAVTVPTVWRRRRPTSRPSSSGVSSRAWCCRRSSPSMLAYIGDEWPPAQVAGVAGIYVVGLEFGGFCGRFIPGVLVGPGRLARLVPGAGGDRFVGAVVVVIELPRERRFVRSTGSCSGPADAAPSAQPATASRPTPSVSACCSISSPIFTYVSFHLAAPPYNFSPALLGALFVTYLVGPCCAPLTDAASTRFGRRGLHDRVIGVWAVGLALCSRRRSR